MVQLSPKARHAMVAICSLAGLGAVVFLVNGKEKSLAARSLSQVDAAGNEWSLTMRGGRSLAAMQKNGKNPGPPLKVGVNIRRQEQQAYIGLVVTGQVGEYYVGGAKKNGKTVPPPQFKILTKSGQVVGSGRFEYG